MIRSVSADGRPDVGGVFTPIERPRVVERIAAAARYRIAAVIAPAGFGKSVAVRQFLTGVPSALVYDVPRDAITLVPFVRGFTAALAERVPELAATLPSALRGIAGSERPGADLAAWFGTHVSRLDGLIAIDDLHHGENDPETGRFVAALLDARDGAARWLLASRSTAGLPLASWLAYGEMDLVVDAVDLRFTLEEARQSAKAARLAVRDEELRAILDLVEGWPTALAFALRSSTRASDLRAVAASTREMIYRYLVEQVYASLDDETRRFLRFAALLPQLEMRFAVAAGFDNALAIVERLRERVAFVTALDRATFRLHDLFRDFMRHQCALEGANVLDGELRAVAAVLEREREFGAALERFIEARAEADIARLLEAVGFGLLDAGQADVVDRALTALPRGRAAASLALRTLQAALDADRGRTDRAESVLCAVIDAAPPGRLRRDAALRLARVYADTARPAGVPALRLALAEPDISAGERCEVHGMLAVLHAVSGEIDAAQTEISAALALSATEPAETRARIFGRACGIAMVRREDDDVERYGAESVRLALEAGNPGIAARTYSLLGSSTLWDPARRERTASYVEQSTALAKKAGDWGMRARQLLLTIEFEGERGDADAIAASAAELAQLRAHAGMHLQLSERGARALAAAWQGDFAAAHQHVASVPVAGLDADRRVRRHALVAVFLAAGERREEAQRALSEALADAPAGPAHYPASHNLRIINARLVILATIVLGKRTQAQRMLRALEPLAGLDGFDAALRALASDDAHALEVACARMTAARFGGFARLIDRIAGARAAAEPAGDDALTTVELEVLRSMAHGAGNKAIADEHRRTVNTIRTHVSAILRKLRAKTRGEAVAAARARGLV